ncbi:M28 family peptidase [Tundrisphaera sp. TA3]|uniref:M28 family peptidase n=1 Tax=Tundrisphaera sp. TA3 TaxID=3435775 RepID=UPI003EBE9F5B
MLLLLATGGPADGAEPELPRLRSHVETLASPEFAGRRGEGAARSRDYILAEFRRLGLAPLFGESYTQEIPDANTGEVLGVNVAARIPGTDPALRDEWVVLGVHYDHLGSRDGFYFPGADDNASGVAMMLEVARSIAEGPEKPRRGIAFVGFDLEEVGPKGEFGLRGSRYFANHSPIPIDQIRLFVTADMIGRALGGVCLSKVFVLGSEHAPGLRPWIADAAKGRPAEVALLGADMLVIDRSDYGPFLSRSVPFLFFTTGENPVYHTPRDVAETLDYPKFEAISRIIMGVIRESTRAEKMPTWSAVPDHPVAEALAVRDVLRILIENRDRLKIGQTQLFLMRNCLRVIDGIEERRAMTPAERTGIVRVAQVVLFTVF